VLRLAESVDEPVVSPPLLKPKCGQPGICRVVDVEGTPVVDLGFSCFLDLPDETPHQPGAFVRLDAAGRVNAAPDANRGDLFTYSAVVLKVVDGDTLWVKIYLRPKQWIKQKLRLRDLDCPEIAAPEGKVAKRFVEGLLAEDKRITICTTKPDKYDRYLADVFLPLPGQSPLFLNNALLSNTHATLKRAWEFGDWEN